MFLLLIIIVIIFIIGIPVLLSLGIYKTLKKKEVNSKWRILAFLPIFIVGYFVYEAVYPSPEFYKEDFKEVTGIELPANSKFEYKTASFPDQFGDYTSVSIINVGFEFYKSLQSDLTINKLTKNRGSIGCTEMDNVQLKMNELKIESEYSKQDGDKFYYVAFLSDRKTILVQRSSH